MSLSSPLTTLSNPLRRLLPAVNSDHFDLFRLIVALFASFMMHDALQETLSHGAARLNRTPLAMTALDFVGCTFGGLCMKLIYDRRRRRMQLMRKRTGSDAELGEVTESLVRSASPLNGASTSASSSRRRGLDSLRLEALSPSSTTTSAAVPPPPVVEPFFTYFFLGALILCSNFLGIFSLRFVDYPLKVVLRSSKLIPTMVLGRFFMKKKYQLIQYAAACSLCLGVITFTLADYAPASSAATHIAPTNTVRPLSTDESDLNVDGPLRRLLAAAAAAAPDNASGSNAAWFLFGIFLLVLSVFIDAINPNIAEYVMRKSKPTATTASAASGPNGAASPSSPSALLAATPVLSPSQPQQQQQGGGGHGHGKDDATALEFLFRTNLAMLPILLSLVFISGEYSLFFAAVAEQPQVLFFMALYSTVSFTGVQAYTSIIARHGPAVAVALATVRKFATLAFSYAFIPTATASTAATTTGEAPHAKRFGTAQLFPSCLILFGLLLSAYNERKKHNQTSSASAAASAASASSSSSEMSTLSMSAEKNNNVAVSLSHLKPSSSLHALSVPPAPSPRAKGMLNAGTASPGGTTSSVVTNFASTNPTIRRSHSSDQQRHWMPIVDDEPHHDSGDENHHDEEELLTSKSNK